MTTYGRHLVSVTCVRQAPRDGYWPWNPRDLGGASAGTVNSVAWTLAGEGHLVGYVPRLQHVVVAQHNGVNMGISA